MLYETGMLVDCSENERKCNFLADGIFIIRAVLSHYQHSRV
jgi:hypothetical protein